MCSVLDTPAAILTSLFCARVSLLKWILLVLPHKLKQYLIFGYMIELYFRTEDESVNASLPDIKYVEFWQES